MNEQESQRTSGGITRRGMIGGLGAIAAVGAVGTGLGRPSSASAATTWYFPLTTRPAVLSGGGYGNRLDPVTHQYALHDGVDYPIGEGTPVYAMRAGKVTFDGVNGGYGNYVGVAHDDGFETGYAHLLKIVAQTGQSVQAGTLVGYSGSTGWSTGPHLHLRMLRNGSSYDPTSILNAAPLATGKVVPSKPDKPTDDDFVVIYSDGRGYAAVGAGYFRGLPTEEFVGAATALFGPAKEGNDREFDVWKANALQGQTVRF